jgi:hypothetical protein
MLVKKAVGDAIYSNQVRLATMILSSGQQVAGLQVQQGEVQAQADLAVAQINYNTAESQANNSILGYVASLAAPTVNVGAGPPSASIPSPGPTLTAVENAYDQAAAALQIGQVQANAARQLADLNSQITQIQASEQAQMQYVNADTTMLNLSADLDALRLQAKSQAVQVQLAAQNVDQET